PHSNALSLACRYPFGARKSLQRNHPSRMRLRRPPGVMVAEKPPDPERHGLRHRTDNYGEIIVIDWIFDEAATEDLEKQVRALGDKVTALKADVSKVEDLEKLVEAAVKTFGRLDIMVNN